MAKNLTAHVNDMTTAAIPEGTAQYLQIKSPKGAIAAYARWAAFDADNAAWRLANPGEAIDPTVVPFAEAVDEDNPIIDERMFIQSRFMVTYSNKPGVLVSEPAQWAQINTTNFPTMDIPAYRQAAKNMYDAQRIFEDLVPPV